MQYCQLGLLGHRTAPCETYVVLCGLIPAAAEAAFVSIQLRLNHPRSDMSVQGKENTNKQTQKSVGSKRITK